MAAAMMIPSASGVSTTRSSPYLSSKPCVALKTPPERPMSSPNTNTRSSRDISWSSASVIASMNAIVRAMLKCFLPHLPLKSGAAASGPNVLEQFVRFRVWALFGEFHRFVYSRCDFRRDLLLQIVTEELPVGQVLLHSEDRILFLPRLDFLFGAVLRGVDFRMPVPAVSFAFKQRGPFARAGALDGCRRRVIDSQDVIAVHGDAGEAISLGSVGKVCQRGLQAERNRFGPQIVHASIEDGQALHSREIQRFMEPADRGRAVAKKRHDDGVLSQFLRPECDAGAHVEL